MNLPFRAVAFVVGVIVVATISTTAGLVVRGIVGDALLSEAQRHLAHAAVLGGEQVRASQDVDPSTLVRSLAQGTGYRVTLVAGDLSLLADSDSPEAPGSADGGDHRTEAATALRGVSASAVRTSPLDGREYVFHARRVYWGGNPIVLRLGTTTDVLMADAASAAVRSGLAFAGTASLILLLVTAGAGRVGQAMRRQAQFLRALSRGRRDVSPPPSSTIRELKHIAAAAARVGNELQGQIAQANRERDELTQLMDQVAEGLLALTEDARVLRINPAAKELLGVSEISPFAPIGSIVRDPKLRALLEKSVIKPEIRTDASIAGRELQVTTKRTESGGSVVLLMDVTEVRRLEEVRTDFVANASHELKTPLTVIRGASETILDEGLPEDLRDQFLVSIQRNTVRLQRLVDDLLDLSRFESGVWRPDEMTVAVGDVAWNVWSEIEVRAAEKGVAFSVIGEGTGLGDEAAIYQVFQNLFENALRYVPEGTGEIAVELTESGDELRVSVADNGAGIPASSLPRIFERFYRVDAARSREEGGTGLGLAIVRHLIASMGGDVSAESALGEGTAISFTLPRARGSGARLSTA